MQDNLPVATGTRIRSVRSIRGTAADDVWAVAQVVRDDRSDRERQTQGYHFDGRAWSAVTLPARIDRVAAVAKDDAWAVGKWGTYAHWDGRSWSEDRIPVDFDLLSVAAIGSEAWVAVSSEELYHFGGGAWAPVRDPLLAKLRVQEVFAIAGQFIVPATWQGEAALARHDGRAWQKEVIGSGAAFKFAGTSKDDLWGFGAKGQAFHFDGKTWNPMSVGGDGYPIDAWAVAPEDVWVVGKEGMIRHWDGSAWKAVASGTKEMLWSVWGVPGGPVFVGGDAGLLRMK